VTTFFEQARSRTTLEGAAVAHTQRLVASWQPLADLCFSDLLLLAPLDPSLRRFVVVAQVRPTTGQTLYRMDLVGAVVDDAARPLLAAAWRGAAILDGDATVLGSSEHVRVQHIPVRHSDDVVAIVSRETRTTLGRQLGELEHHYLAVFDRLAAMITEGSFPFAQEEVEFEDAPRVGDGAILLGPDRRVQYASPNAVSALHRLGIFSYAPGLLLSEMGLDSHAADVALAERSPETEELESGDTSVLVRVIPLVAHGRADGALVLVRDVSDLRRRDRMLVSKDATIREIHHRVKNNLQTIAALLRLQGRRASPEAQAAIEESERRIRSIAIVHETLSREAGDVVAFNEIVQPLVRVVEETVATPGGDLRFTVEGDAGLLPGDIATPLAVVLNELMQNAVDHAFGRVLHDGPLVGSVRVELARDADRLLVDVVDDGVGLPPGFTIGESGGLGLSIVHALVTTELGGSIELHGGHGTRVHLTIPLGHA
jgi:two-component sensor histidine kinase